MSALIYYIGIGLLISFIDIKTHRIPNQLNAYLYLTLLFSVENVSILNRIFVSLFAALLLFIPSLIFSGAIGMGDVKFQLNNGLLLAPLGFSHACMALEIALVLASMFLLILLIKHRTLGSLNIAFGPFLFAGSLITYLSS